MRHPEGLLLVLNFTCLAACCLIQKNSPAFSEENKTLLPKTLLSALSPRRTSALSITSSCSRLATWISSVISAMRCCCRRCSAGCTFGGRSSTAHGISSHHHTAYCNLVALGLPIQHLSTIRCFVPLLHLNRAAGRSHTCQESSGGYKGGEGGRHEQEHGRPQPLALCA